MQRVLRVALEVVLDPPAELLGPEPAVDHPLGEPRRLQRQLRRRGQSGQDVLRTEGGKSLLGPRVLVRIAAVDRNCPFEQHQAGGEIGLIGEVPVNVLAEIAAGTDVEWLGDESIDSRERPVLNSQPLPVVGQVVHPRLGGAHSLLDPQGKIGDGLEQELRQIRSGKLPFSVATEEGARRDPARLSTVQPVQAG